MNFSSSVSETDANQTTLFLLQLIATRNRLDQIADSWSIRITRVTLPLHYVAYGFGILGSLLTIITALHWDQRQFSSSFRSIMIVISGLDAIFLLLKAVRPHLPLRPDLALGFYMFVCGFIYACSLMSDLLGLSLSMERYTALMYPLFHKNLSRTTVRLGWLVSISVWCLLSATRFHYSLSNYYFVLNRIDQEPWFVVICFISDAVLPCFLTVASLAFTVAIFQAVLRRCQSGRVQGRNAVRASQSIDTTIGPQFLRTVSLLFALLAGCFLTQFGYAGYQISCMIYDHLRADRIIGYDQLYRYFTAKCVYIVFSSISSYCEVLARSMLFYLYIAFNRSFRHTFTTIFYRLCNTISGVRSSDN